VLTLLLYGLLAIAVIAELFLLAANLLPPGEQIAAPVRDESPWDLPASRLLVAEDVAGLRLPVALRGYRFAEKDLLLDRLVEELRTRDAELERLREHGGSAGATNPESPGGLDTRDTSRPDVDRAEFSRSPARQESLDDDRAHDL
jgi:hypothetical protein